ncbi:MAG: DUF4124 domain-containing protein [Desulfobacteraceae bacterium]|jgi:hypothetical protein|nr:DUF4124 domain-containing protein [Desulfobacteraceae bacterium]
MKKALAVIVVIVLSLMGFLYYDWHTKTKKQAVEPSIPQYSWTDARGARHFTDRPPPPGATHIKETRGYKSIDPPLVVTIKTKVLEYYKKTKEALFRPKKKKKRRE